MRKCLEYKCLFYLILYIYFKTTKSKSENQFKALKMYNQHKNDFKKYSRTSYSNNKELDDYMYKTLANILIFKLMKKVLKVL